MENSEQNKVPSKHLWMDWFVYTLTMLILTIPFYEIFSWKHFGISIILGFFASLLNRIIRELVFIKNKK